MGCIPFCYLYPLQFVTLLMKKQLLLLVTALFVLSSFFCSCTNNRSKQKAINTNNEAQITFTDTVHNFGTFSTKFPIQKFTFHFKNLGTTPIAILDADPSCRCITVDYTKELVRSNQSGIVEITFDGREASPGYFNKSVRIRINSFRIYTLNVSGIMKE